MRTYTGTDNESRYKSIQLQGDLLIIQERCRLPAGCSANSLQHRGAIREFSPSSGMRMRRFLRCCKANYRTLITLTYPHGFGLDGRQSKEHLRRFIQELSREVARYHTAAYGSHEGLYRLEATSDAQCFGAFWFMEFQRSGTIHYHMFVTHGFKKQWVAKKWYEIVGSEDKRHLQAGTRIEALKKGRGGMSAYASKYASKQEQKTPPPGLENCGRFWGVAGERGIVVAATVFPVAAGLSPAVERRYKRLREVIKDGVEAGEIKRIRVKRDGVALFSIKSWGYRHQLNAAVHFLDMQVRLDLGVYCYDWGGFDAESVYL